MTENNRPTIGGLLLAAGGSSRLGRPKQLVEFEGKTLIRRAAEALVEAGCNRIFVVIGSDADLMRRELRGLTLEIVENQDWQAGMSSSIRRGMHAVLNAELSLEAILVTLVDQPLISSGHLASFLRRFSSDRAPIIAAEYAGTYGVPALFERSYFRHLAEMSGDKGARDLLRSEPRIESISLSEACLDIDTLTDLKKLGDG